MTETNDLRDLPNVGPALARELLAAGVDSAARLRQLGPLAAWERVREVNPERDCASSLLALEGAVRGVRWMAIDEPERRRLGAYAAARRRR
jgi:DNA transformation protein